MSPYTLGTCVLCGRVCVNEKYFSVVLSELHVFRLRAKGDFPIPKSPNSKFCRHDHIRVGSRSKVQALEYRRGTYFFVMEFRGRLAGRSLCTRRKLPWEEKRPRGSREREPAHVRCEHNESDGEAHQQLPKNFAISSEERLAQPRL